MELLKTKKEDYDEVSKRLTNDDISFYWHFYFCRQMF